MRPAPPQNLHYKLAIQFMQAFHGIQAVICTFFIMKKLARHSSGRPCHRPSSLDLACLFRLALHFALCISALLLGFRLSTDTLLLFVSFKHLQPPFFRRSFVGDLSEMALSFPYVKQASTPSLPLPQKLHAASRLPSGTKSNRVHVGRHQILIRPWPHPDPVQTLVAHRLLHLVQDAQQRNYGLKQRRQLLVITPTYVRTLQALQLNSVIHTLRMVPSSLTWIVVEAGGLSNETSTILSSSQLSYYHLGFQEAMPAVCEDRQRLETRLRIEGLRFIRERQLDGIVMFADESNTYSLDFFDEVQKVKWIGMFSVVVSHSGEDSQVTHDEHPACNSAGHIVGWHASKKQEMGPSKSCVWCGFSLNARLLWEEEYEKPTWIRSWNELFGDSETLVRGPLDFVKNTSFVETLGHSGQGVLMWWVRVEAPADHKFPARWLIDPSLKIVVPSKRTPWPDPPVRYPPPLAALLSSDITIQHGGNKTKQGTRKGRGKHGSHHGENKKQGTHGNAVSQQAPLILADMTKE